MSSRARLLVIDDDQQLLTALRRALAYEGYDVAVADSGEAGLRLARERPPDLVVLDVLLPGLDGLEVCRRLRAGGDVPILMLTARDEVSDRVAGLDAGADDYLVKPFAVDELLARVRALLRRRVPPPEEWRFADLVLRPSTREVLRGERPLVLTPREFDLLALFLQHPRQVLTREVLMERVWGPDYDGESNVLEVYIGHLRNKLEAGGEPRLLHTVRGVGYVLKE
ncbi:MAG: response regulator transcription factor [Chloroflexi bacterium]|nr:response regulator transcription factor [Chloroflexota bacterium]